MDDLGRLLLLYDFYGSLLTEKQRRAFELHYDHDLSLGEVAEDLEVSRPAVADLLRRARGQLMAFEAHVGAVGRWQEERRVLGDVLAILTGEGPDRSAAAIEVLRSWLQEDETDV